MTASIQIQSIPADSHLHAAIAEMAQGHVFSAYVVSGAGYDFHAVIIARDLDMVVTARCEGRGIDVTRGGIHETDYQSSIEMGETDEQIIDRVYRSQRVRR